VPATRPVASFRRVSNFATCPPEIVLLFVVSSFIETDNESLSGLSCLALPPCPRPEPGRAYRSVFPSRTVLTGNCKRPGNESTDSNQQSRITEILPELRPGNESGELAFCNETRQEQIQNQRKRTKKISAAAVADFIIASEQADLHEAKQAKSK